LQKKETFLHFFVDILCVGNYNQIHEVVKSRELCFIFPKSGAKGGCKMTGVYQHTIDAKGRLAIPARLRDELGDSFYVTLSAEKCLSAYSNESWNDMMERIKALPRLSQKKMRPLFAHATKCELDSQGRILLPQTQRDYANLKKNVTVVGTGELVEIWDSEEWAGIDEVETTPEYIEDIFRELGV
jgi:MraZ protein